MRRRRYLVGLTGGLASGKSTVARWFAEAGFTVVDADQLVAELYAPGGLGARALAELFGTRVLDPSGAVDKPRVAAIVFSGTQARQQVEAAIHPLVHERFRQIAAASEGVVVYEATLLVESGHADAFDLVLSIEAPAARRLEWAVSRGLSEAQAKARLDAQGDGSERRSGADRIIANDGSLDDLRRRIDDLIEELRAQVA